MGSQDFQDEPDRQEIKYISWLPGGGRLLFVKNDESSSFPNQEIGILNVKDGSQISVAKGGIWDIQEADDSGNMKTHISQKDFDYILQTYGAKAISIQEAGRVLFTKFSSPSISKDGDKIIYSATLYRNIAPTTEKLWIASGIWVYDLKSATSKLVYSNPDGQAVGRVIWNKQHENEVIFISYNKMNGENGFREDAKRLLIHEESHVVEPQQILIQKTPELLWNFTVIN